MRFLIDECLSPLLVSVAAQSGYEAYHIVHLGKAGWTDPEVTRYAIDGDFILVTNNASDVRRLYRRELLHSGLVIIVQNVNRAEQMGLFRDVIARLTAWGEPVKVDGDGGGVVFRYSVHRRDR